MTLKAKWVSHNIPPTHACMCLLDSDTQSINKRQKTTTVGSSKAPHHAQTEMFKNENELKPKSKFSATQIKVMAQNSL